MDAAEIERLVRVALPDAVVTLSDLTGTADHFSAVVVSRAFEGRTPVEQHRLVYGALKDAMSGPIHALALKTHTPEAWAKLAGSKGYTE